MAGGWPGVVPGEGGGVGRSGGMAVRAAVETGRQQETSKGSSKQHWQSNVSYHSNRHTLTSGGSSSSRKQL